MRPADIPRSINPTGWERVTYAKDQPEYTPLPVLRSPGPSGEVISRWTPTFRERLRLIFGGSIWLTALTFSPRLGMREHLQPVRLAVDPPEFVEEDDIYPQLGKRFRRQAKDIHFVPEDTPLA
jgi:hypothetical protein